MEGDELRDRRERLGLSVGQLAREFGVIPSSIYRWESGAITLHGLTAIGADTVLRRLERRGRPSPAAPDAGRELEDFIGASPHLAESMEDRDDG